MQIKGSHIMWATFVANLFCLYATYMEGRPLLTALCVGIALYCPYAAYLYRNYVVIEITKHDPWKPL